MKIFLIGLGITIFAICLYIIMAYQLTIEIPSNIHGTKYENFYRLGYMTKNYSALLFPATLVIPSIIITTGTTWEKRIR